MNNLKSILLYIGLFILQGVLYAAFMAAIIFAFTYTAQKIFDKHQPELNKNIKTIQKASDKFFNEKMKNLEEYANE